MNAGVRAAAQAFGVRAEPVLLARSTWRAGGLVLKPADQPELWVALAETVAPVPRSRELRFPYPVRSTQGEWIAAGHVAWEFLEGEEQAGRYAEKLRACDAFDAAFAALGKPDFFARRDDPWARADRVAWGEAEARYGEPFGQIVEDLQGRLEPLELPQQVVHGDIAGNLVFAAGLPTGVIDLTLYWRPADFAKAVLILDAVAHEGADPAPFLPLCRKPVMRQLVLRAALRRIAEQPEQMRAFGKSLGAALEIATPCRRALDRLSLL